MITRQAIDVAQALRAYGVRCGRRENSTLSGSTYFFASANGRKMRIRVSDHDLPNRYVTSSRDRADGCARVDVRLGFEEFDFAVDCVLRGLGLVAEADARAAAAKAQAAARARRDARLARIYVAREAWLKNVFIRATGRSQNSPMNDRINYMIQDLTGGRFTRPIRAKIVAIVNAAR
jgi:hypothetical protein